MEAFQLLSRGGVTFDKKRFKKEVHLFDSKGDKKSISGTNLASGNAELPSELDYFKYASTNSLKRKASRSQNASQAETTTPNADTDEEDGGEISADDKGEGPSQARHRVTSKGSNVPQPVNTFKAFQKRYNIPSRIMRNLEESGYRNPTSIQSHGCPILLEGRDLAAISPTGTGKTLSYLLPVMVALGAPMSAGNGMSGAGVRAVIVAPTRELAHQIHNECLKLAQGRKWRIILLSKATASTLSDKSVRDKVDIIISTPLRLVDSLISGTMELNNVRHLVLDEADRLLDSEFLGQTQEILTACNHQNIQKAVFSATLPAGVEKIAMGFLQNSVRIVVGIKDTPLPLIKQALTYVADESWKLSTILQHLSQPYSPPIIIFTSTQPRASSLAEHLILNNVLNVDCLHAGMSNKEREDTAARMRKGETWVMITTEVMARGIDFKGVRGVINFDFPTSVQSYIHRIGRTGRAGQEGNANTYFTDADAPFLKPIANVLLQSGSPVPDWITKLPKPSRMKRRQMGKLQRGDAVSKDNRIGRSQAMKKRDMIDGSKRRKLTTV